MDNNATTILKLYNFNSGRETDAEVSMAFEPAASVRPEPVRAPPRHRALQASSWREIFGLRWRRHSRLGSLCSRPG